MDKLTVTWRDFRIQLDREFRKSSDSPFFRGMIMAWRRPLAEIPEGWALCNGENGTVDLRGSFIKCVDADEEPGATGGSANHTPTGLVEAPAFTGDEGRTGDTSAGVPSGTFAGNAGVTGATSGGTPAGTNDAPAFTGTSANTSSVSAGTPAGTNANESTHTHSFTATGSINSPDVVAPDVTATGVAPAGTTDAGSAHTHTFTGSAMSGHQHTVTATGTVAAPIFTGTALATHTHTFTPSGTLTGNPMGAHSHTFTPAGSISAPEFTGAPGNFEPPFYKLAFIEKL